jgi:hypothetical protein
MGLRIAFVLELGGGGVWEWLIVCMEHGTSQDLYSLPKGGAGWSWKVRLENHAGKGEWHGQYQC